MSKNAPRLKTTTSRFEPKKVVYNQANNGEVEKHYRICEAPKMRLAANLRGLGLKWRRVVNDLRSCAESKVIILQMPVRFMMEFAKAA